MLASGVISIVAQGAPAGYSAVVGGLGANGYAAHSPNGYSASAALVIGFSAYLFFVLTMWELRIQRRQLALRA